MDENNESQTDEGLNNESDESQEEGAPEGDSRGEETVTLKKSEYEKVLTERDNYKKGMLAAKGKNQPQKPAPQRSETNALSREEFLSYVESQAVEDLTTMRGNDTPEEKTEKAFLKEHMNDIVKFMPEGINKGKITEFKEGILDATLIYKRRNPEKKKEENTEVKSFLGHSKGTQGETPTFTQDKQPNKFFEINRKGGMQDWFKKEE